MSARVGILGGGISGLSLAYFVGKDAVVLEKENATGGLCRTFEKDGFLFDQGGHALFSHDKQVLALVLELLGDNIVKNRRNSCIWYAGRAVKYPFENGIAVLDKQEIFEILRDYLDNPSAATKPTNLEEWVRHTFGAAFSEKYMLPYNRKIWKLDPLKMGMEFVERIPKPPLEDMLRSAIGIETEGYTFQLHYYYPKVGGFESLVRAFEAKVANVEKNVDVRSVARRGDEWEVAFADGTTRRFPTFVSTIPIFDLLPLLEGGVPDDVKAAVARLRYNSLRVVLVGAKKLLRPGYATVYVAGPDSLAHRYCFSDGFSPGLAPPSCASIFAEITHHPGDGPGPTDSEMTERTVAWLVREGWIDAADVMTTDVRHVKYAYPVYDLEYSKSVAIVHQHFENIGLHLLGRFAQFLYINSDVCIKNARELSKRI